VLAPARSRGRIWRVLYVLLCVDGRSGLWLAGYLQDVWGSPSAALIAGAALLVAAPLLSLAFKFLSKPYRHAELNHDAELRAAVRAGGAPRSHSPRQRLHGRIERPDGVVGIELDLQPALSAIQKHAGLGQGCLVDRHRHAPFFGANGLMPPT